jgi:hypothetical protein
LYARAGGGYDDNVALRSESIDGAASGDSDAFTELQFGASATFARAWSVDAGAATVNHRDLDEFDQSAFSLGARRGFDRDGWRADVGAYVARLTLDGEAFEQSAALVLNAAGTLGGVHMLRGHYRLVSVDGRGAYEGLSGTRNHFRFEYQRPRARWTFGARASAEFNDTEDALFESRWSELGASASWAQSPRWAYAVDVAARRTDHSADPGVREAWDERRLTFGVSVYRALLERLQIVLRYEHERNSASLADYDYDRNRASASIEYWQ